MILCLPALLFLIVMLIVLTVTMALTLSNILFVILWTVLLQWVCTGGYSTLAWVLLFVPAIGSYFYRF